MCRRIFAILMLPLVLMNSSAMFAHGHGEFDPIHSSRHHVHVKADTHSHTHSHDEHAHGHHHGDHHHGTVDTHDECVLGLNQSSSDCPEDHDSDAIYVNVSDMVAVELTNFDTSLDLSSDCIDKVAGTECLLQSSSDFACSGELPPRSSPTPLYVRHCLWLI